jgi:hypothetical protein
VELELRLALAEADDVQEKSCDERFKRLQDSADAAQSLNPKLPDEIMDSIDGVCLSLAAERTFVLQVAEAEDVSQGKKEADPDEVIKCAEKLKNSISAAQEDAQEAALENVPAAEELMDSLQNNAQQRKEILDSLNKTVQTRGSTMRDLMIEIVKAREVFLPRSLLEGAYARLRKQKLEFCAPTLKTAMAQGQIARGLAFWYRGKALRAHEERNGQEWITGELSKPPPRGPYSIIIEGEFTKDRSGGSFGMQNWRKNPYYVVRAKYDEASLQEGPSGRRASVLSNVKVTMVMAEVGDMPSTLAVHVVKNNETAASVGLKNTLVPGFEVIACSDDDDDIPDCTFELPPADEEEESEWPTFIVPSAAPGELGPFRIVLDSTMPLVVEEVSDAERWPWVHKEVVNLEWANRRPFALTMGGGRSAASAPMLSWYRNPQFRVRLKGECSEEPAPCFMAHLVPTEGRDQDPAAVHICRNKEDPAAEADGRLEENPNLHEVVACSGPENDEYINTPEEAAVCNLQGNEEVIVVPSMKTRKSAGTYTLRFLATQPVVVERL